jgi:AcrR family transcriptional regulator
MRHLANKARLARHAAVIDEATLEFNRAGAAAASLNTIARRVGITRAALYNYCADHHDLAAQCYLRACADIQAALQRAALGPGRGLDKVIAFLHLILDPAHRPVATISELGFLRAEQEAAVRSAHGENVCALEEILAGGVEDDSIRACDLDIAAHCIFGMLAWRMLSRIHDYTEDEFGPRIAAVMPVLVANGAAAEGAQFEPCRLRITDVVPPRSGQNGPVEALARAGSNLFNRRGVDGVSLDEVASELGLTKGAIHHHFNTKAEFVAYCYERAFEIYEAVLDIAGTGKTGLECMTLLHELTAQAQLEDIHALWPTTGFGSLSNVLQRRMSGCANVNLGRSVELARRGMIDGTLRKLDLLPMMVAMASADALLAEWLPADEKRSPGKIANGIGRFLSLGLRNRVVATLPATRKHRARRD